MAITNRIVTRGLGKSRGVAGRAGLVTQGYGGIAVVIFTEAAIIKRAVGRTAAKRIDEIVVFAKLVRVNQKKSLHDIKGSVRIPWNYALKSSIRLIETVKTRTLTLLNIIVKRIK